MDTVTCFDVAGLALMPDKGKAQLTMFEMGINRRRGRWGAPHGQEYEKGEAILWEASSRSGTNT